MIKTNRRSVLVALVATICALVSPVVRAQTLAPLYPFDPSTSDPYDFSWPAIMAQGVDGYIYTTSPAGGVAENEAAGGTVFNMSPTGSLLELFTFGYVPGAANDGVAPYGGVTLGTDGNFYGTAVAGGGLGYGDIFSITPNGSLSTLTDLYDFTGGSDGGNPYSAPIEGTDGNFYGTTACGGAAACPSGYGTVYQFVPSTGTLNTIHVFQTSDGYPPIPPLVQGTDGNFYGTTEFGGKGNIGTVFKISSGGTFNVLYNFDGTHGAEPLAPLVQGKDGNFYGTTTGGGIPYSGVVFKITPASKLTVLHEFGVASGDGSSPLTGLIQATDGYFYGVTDGGGSDGYGTIFHLTSKSGSYSTLYSFTNGTDGSGPNPRLLQHTNGLFYGITNSGSTYGAGAFFSFDEGLEPFVSMIPTSGAVGAPVGILGQGFTGTKKVTFTGGAAAFTVVSDTYITATVPARAKTGYINVKTPTGTLKSNQKFIVTQ